MPKFRLTVHRRAAVAPESGRQQAGFLASILLMLMLMLAMVWGDWIPLRNPDLVQRSVVWLVGSTFAYLLLVILTSWGRGASLRRVFLGACLIGLIVNVLIVVCFDHTELAFLSRSKVQRNPTNASRSGPREGKLAFRWRQRSSSRADRWGPTDSPMQDSDPGLTRLGKRTVAEPLHEGPMDQAGPERTRVTAHRRQRDELAQSVSRQARLARTLSRQAKQAPAVRSEVVNARPASESSEPRSTRQVPPADTLARQREIPLAEPAIVSPESPASADRGLGRQLPPPSISMQQPSIRPSELARGRTRKPPELRAKAAGANVTARAKRELVADRPNVAKVATQPRHAAEVLDGPQPSMEAFSAVDSRRSQPFASDRRRRAVRLPAGSDLEIARAPGRRGEVARPNMVPAAIGPSPEATSVPELVSVPENQSVASSVSVDRVETEAESEVVSSDALADASSVASSVSEAVTSRSAWEPAVVEDVASLPTATRQRTELDRALPSPQATGSVAAAPAADRAAPRPPMAAPSEPRKMAGRTEDLTIVDVEASAGVGGLGASQATLPGLPQPDALPESDVVASLPSRFLRRQLGAPRARTRVSQAIATPAFTRREDRPRPDGASGAPVARTNESIEAGLAYLAVCQMADGCWKLRQAGGDGEAHPDEVPSMESPTAATGLALLAFFGGGYHHMEGKYRDVLTSGVRYLVDHQQLNGDLYVEQDIHSNRAAWLYSHAIAAMAICEAYGMTQDAALRGPAQRAVNFIGATQHPELGGWRYQPGMEADTSVSGWMLMALKSAELAGLDVPEENYRGLRKWLGIATGEDKPYLYRYNPFADDSLKQRHGRVPSKSMTAVGLVMQLYLGSDERDPKFLRGIEQLRRYPPSLGTLRASLRDTYYWYYATLAVYYAGGKTFDTWNQRLHEVLLPAQLQDGPLRGSWDPYRPVPDRWVDHGGRIYVTAMNLLSLEVEYRHLPLYHWSDARP